MVQIGPNSKAQVHLLETLFAIAFLTGVLFVSIEVLEPTPQLETPEDSKVKASIQTDADRVLDQSRADGELKYSILNWNEDIDRYNQQSSGYQTGGGFYTGFSQLNSTLSNRIVEMRARHSDAERAIGINVQLIPAENGLGTTERTEAFDNSNEAHTTYLTTRASSQQSIVVTNTITLHGSDELRAPPETYQTDSYGVAAPNEHKKLHELTNTDSFPQRVIPPRSDLDEIGPDDIYNTVEVRMIIWF